MDLSWLDRSPHVDLTLRLSTDDLLKAARIGGHHRGEAQFAREARLMQDDATTELMVLTLAGIGLQTALREIYDRRYPRRYPEDFSESELSNVVPFAFRPT